MKRVGLLVAIVLMSCSACDSGAAPVDESMVGSWTVKNVGPFAGSIMSFRKEGTMRILMTIPPAQLDELRQLPPDEQARQGRSLVVQNGTTYFNVNGTWEHSDADKIKTVVTVGNGEKRNVIYVVRHIDKSNMELKEGGVPATQLQYVYQPLPAD